ncbi:MAG: alpha/beta hydrolase [Patescibacteria group bacterium]|nr:alpha/beta hydrolase [Patescibacteria group bacterium]
MEKKIKSHDSTIIVYDINRFSKEFLVFVHGAGGDLTAWKKERAFFHKKGISTLAVDLRGHGKSGRPDTAQSYSLKNFAKDIGIVLEKEKISEFSMIGHCFGGMVTVMFEKIFPEKAKAYILIDTAYKAPGILNEFVKYNPFLVNFLNRALEKYDLNRKRFGHVNFDKFIGGGDYDPARIYSDIIHTSLKSWLFTYENLARYDGVPTLKKIRKPVLIIEGEKDSIFDVSVAKKINRLIKSSRLVVVPEENHIINLNNPAIIDKNIWEFLNKIEFFKK